MSRYSFFDAQGTFTGRTWGGSRKLLAANTPAGLVAIVGTYDPESQRVDVKSGEVVDYQPPQPSPDHEWHENVFEGRPRWVKKAAVVEREARASQALQRIDDLERSQLRPARELALDPNNVTAKQRLADIEAEIAARRADL